MTPEEFRDEIRKAYIDARKITYPPKKFPTTLKRITSRSISSIAEDLFGCYCANKIKDPSNIDICIDPQLSFKGTDLKNKSGKRSLLIRPDVAIIKNKIATCFFDIKTDLGYKRNEFFNQTKERDKQIENIKGKVSTYNDGEDKSENVIQISKCIKFIYIVISPKNMNEGFQKNLIEGIGKLKNIEILFFLKEGHLNSYQDNPECEINKSDFDKLDKLLDEQLNH